MIGLRPRSPRQIISEPSAESGYSDTTFLSQPAILVDSLIKERKTTNGHVA